MQAVCIGTALWAFAAGGAFAQPAATPLTFEVASVKPSAPDVRGMFSRFPPGGGLRVDGATLKNLITLAYGVREFLVSGGPGWVDTERFDIEARAEISDAPENAPTDPAKMSDEQRKLIERLRSLVADRFQLAFHRETKEQQVYVLVVAKGGPKFHESTEAKGRIRMGRGLLTGHGVGLGLLALNLSNELGRRVIDKTGLTGRYDFELKWTRDPGQPAAAPLVSPPPGVELPPPPDPNGPSIFTALPEPLGLRLESQKGPVELLVIDRAEKPSEN